MLVLSNFGLTAATAVALKLNNHRNEVTIVQDATKTCVLKVLSISQQLFEKVMVLEKVLLRHGIPIPRHYQALDGSFFAACNSHTYTLQEYVAGTAWSSSTAQITSLAATLLQLHTTTKELEIDLPLGDVFQNCKQLISNAEEELKQRHTYYSDEGIMTQWKLIALWITAENALCKEHAVQSGYGASRQPIHGDYHPLNALYAENGSVIAVVDFDQACLDDPLIDVLRAMLHIYPFDFTTPLSNEIDRHLAQKKWTPFIEAYGTKIFERECTAWIAKAISLELIVLYHLKGLEKQLSLSKVQSLVSQIEAAVRSRSIQV